MGRPSPRLNKKLKTLPLDVYNLHDLTCSAYLGFFVLFGKFCSNKKGVRNT